MAQQLTDRPLSKTQLFCSNLPWSVNGKMLRQAFEVHGEVIDAFVAYNGRSSRGFGYVTFKEAGPAAAAVASMNGVPLGDDDRSREIRVEMARERPGPRPEPRERSGNREGGGNRGHDSGEGGRGDGRSRRPRARGGRGQGASDEKPAPARDNNASAANGAAAAATPAVEESSES